MTQSQRINRPALHHLAAAAALASLSTGAWAQTAPVAMVEAGKLTTITITAERRPENIKDVPSSVSTLSGEKLDVLTSGGQDIRDRRSVV